MTKFYYELELLKALKEHKKSEIEYLKSEISGLEIIIFALKNNTTYQKALYKKNKKKGDF